MPDENENIPEEPYLTPDGARQLATATKSEPQMLGFSSRWFLKVLPWVNVPGGTYQVNSVVRDDSRSEDEHIDRYGQRKIKVAKGEKTSPALSGAEYNIKPEIYNLDVVRTIMRLPALVADIYNYKQNQTEQQLKLVVATLREEQEKSMIQEHLLPYINAQRLSPKVSNTDGRTLDNLDRLITKIRDVHFILAQPSAIAAIGRAANAAGIYTNNVDFGGQMVPSWRGVPILTCNKLPIVGEKGARTTTLVAMRTGEANHGVIGLYQTGIPDEYEPGLNVRFMGIDNDAIISYLVSAYYSIAALVPDAVGILTDLNIDDTPTGNKGAKGDKGDPGPKGDKGDKGDKGPTGDKK